MNKELIEELKVQDFNVAKDKSQFINLHSVNLQLCIILFEKSHFTKVQSSK